MKFTSRISLQEMQNIRRKVIIHQYNKWKTIFLVIRIAVLLVALVYATVSIFIEPTFGNVLLSVLFALYFVMTDLRMQFVLGERRIAKVLKKANASEVLVKYELHGNALTKEIEMGDKKILSKIELTNLFNFIIEENLVLFSKTKFISNFKKTQLIFITLDGLSKDDKEKLLTLLNQNSVK